MGSYNHERTLLHARSQRETQKTMPARCNVRRRGTVTGDRGGRGEGSDEDGYRRGEEVRTEREMRFSKRKKKQRANRFFSARSNGPPDSNPMAPTRLAERLGRRAGAD